MTKFLLMLVAAYLYVSYVQHFGQLAMRQVNQLQNVYSQNGFDQLISQASSLPR